ncbi:MAG: hypothetical protein JSW51_04000, partial [Gemmatimonadota bacterium]
MQIINRIVVLSLGLIMLGSITQCTSDGTMAPEEQLESVAMVQSTAPPPGAHWLSDYFPLDPHRFGIRTYYS